MKGSDKQNSMLFIYGEFKKFCIFLTPIIYTFVWLLLLIVLSKNLPQEIIENNLFLPLYTIVFLFVLVAKFTSWSIGHDKFGIKGDARSRVINYHGKDYWFDLFADNPDLLKDDKIEKLLKLLTKKEA